MKILCSTQILTRNSEATLERCLESVKNFDDIIILDGNSKDRTLEIARRYGARVFKQYDTDEPLAQITDFAEVRNRGLWLARHDWFMYIDSDEYLSSEAVEEIRAIVKSPSPSAGAFWQPRKYVLDGKVIDCATTYPNQQIRFFHRRYAEGFIKPIHERIKLKAGVVAGTLRGFEYVPRGSVEELDLRWARYIEKELQMYVNVSRKKKLKAALRQVGVFGFYILRYVRNLFFCRGTRMPLAYEWAQHKYLLVFAASILRRLI